jgi:hypothetical protein
MSATERIGFVPGALLAAEDLREEVAAQTDARRRHVRVVHGTWGIALGYTVGQAGDQLVVGPGIAYDCRGRELVSSRTVATAPPAVSGGGEAWFDLALRWCDDDELGGARSPGAPEARERPRLLWSRAGAAVQGAPQPPPASTLGLGEAVPVARVRSGAGGISELSLATRRAARPASGARVASGSTALDFGSERALWSTHGIDTSAGGFQEHPFYFASLAVPGASTQGPLHQGAMLGPLLSISDAGADAFTLTVRFAEGEDGWLDEPLPGIAVDWIGVEPIRGCWPAVEVIVALLDAGMPLWALSSALASFTGHPAMTQEEA